MKMIQSKQMYSVLFYIFIHKYNPNVTEFHQLEAYCFGRKDFEQAIGISSLILKLAHLRVNFKLHLQVLL